MYIFLNTDGVLANVPAWQSAEASIQNFLSFADYDHDEWEDLAVSKWVNFESGIYANLGGVIQTTPAWTTGDDDSDKGVAWADVDGDSWPDLALGHDPTQLWNNDGGSLAVGWTSSASYFGHSDIRFHDIDRDGDADLAETHFSDGKVHIYLNDDGVLESVPSWTYDSPTVGTAIAFGRINGDDWPDLVVGNSGEPCVKVFYAQPTVGVEDSTGNRAPISFRQCAPNPFGTETTIAFALSRRGGVRLELFGATGAIVRCLLDQEMSGGNHTVTWDGRDDAGRRVPSGVYFTRLASGGVAQTMRISTIR
jgi:hypothetical protein